MYAKPELLATALNQVWSWDITKLLGPQQWTYYYLYVVLDIFSRYVVGWTLADCENASQARRLTETCAKHGIDPGTLTLHQDRGGPMRCQDLRADASLYAFSGSMGLLDQATPV